MLDDDDEEEEQEEEGGGVGKQSAGSEFQQAGATADAVSGGKGRRGGSMGRQGLEEKLGRHAANFSCPVHLLSGKAKDGASASSLALHPMALTNLGTDVLYPEGRCVREIDRGL